MTTTVTASSAAHADAVRQPVPLDGYQRRVADGLGAAFDDEWTEEQTLELQTARLIIFSDHHKGARDGADDFLRCEQAYHAALGYYLEAGHRLFVVGDAEELWECRPTEVLEAYSETLALEGEFHRAGRYERFWGNHDDHWRVATMLAEARPTLFRGLRVREALKLRVFDDGAPAGLLFLVHGHQGTLDSDRFAWFSRRFVRHVWRPVQRRLALPSTTPARDFELRARHDAAMFSWARAHPEKPVLIAGHTHRPVFWTSRPTTEGAKTEEDLERELDELSASEDAAPDEVGRLRAALEFMRAERRRGDRAGIAFDPPCYFNTGCCSFGDGDATGIEIVDGDIRLVRWLEDEGRPAAKILATADLREVLASVARPRAAA
jgi:UDP-2,3-diacylglucosamine pyrophosphatase LpxH